MNDQIKKIIIASAASNWIIGKNGSLPWNIPADLQHFKRTTMGFPVLIGRRTFDSIGKILEGRINIVVSRSLEPVTKDNLIIVNSIERGIEQAVSRNYERFYIAGGSSIFAQTIKIAHELIISHVTGDFEGDSYFPKIDLENWQTESISTYPEFVIKLYKKKERK